MILLCKYIYRHLIFQIYNLKSILRQIKKIDERKKAETTQKLEIYKKDDRQNGRQNNKNKKL